MHLKSEHTVVYVDVKLIGRLLHMPPLIRCWKKNLPKCKCQMAAYWSRFKGHAGLLLVVSKDNCAGYTRKPGTNSNRTSWKSGSVSASTISFKGTVSQDFLRQVIFMNHLPPGPWKKHLGYFEFFRRIAGIFTSQGAPPPVSMTPAVNLP